jgi:hypothetical protein
VTHIRIVKSQACRETPLSCVMVRLVRTVTIEAEHEYQFDAVYRERNSFTSVGGHSFRDR